MEFNLYFSGYNPPLSVIAAAKVGGISMSIKSDTTIAASLPPFFLFSNGLKLRGTNVLLRYLGRVSTFPMFYGKDAFESCQVDEWLDYAPIISSESEFEGACGYVDGYLLSRAFLVGNSLTIADIAIWSDLTVTGKRWESLRMGKKYGNLVRWFNSITTRYNAFLSEVATTYVVKRSVPKSTAAKAIEGDQKISNRSVRGDINEKSKAGIGSSNEMDLPDAVPGKVRLRFAPEPSGYLHIGHAKAGLLNRYFAERYGVRLIVRFDDTNPSNESNEFKENILKDIKRLGIEYEEVTYTSDYFSKLMEMAGKLILMGKAYVDETSKEEIKKERMDGIESKCRNNSVDLNMELWNEMASGSERGLHCCLRGKLDMRDPNKALRDPVYYRCKPRPYHRVGNKFKLYPTYDFACPFVDSEEGITHALRSSEYHDRNAQYHKIQDEMGVRKVHIYEFSRLNMAYTFLSKRKLRCVVENGKVDGWDDPRLPTIQGIIRRGLKVEALKQFILEQGASKNLNLMEWDKLWSINKKIIDPVCPRHTAVIKENRVRLTLVDGPEKPFVRTVPRHKKFEGAGEKYTTYSKDVWIDCADAKSIRVDEEITLMDWGNAIVKEIARDAENKIAGLVGVLHLEGSVKTTKLKLTWLSESSPLVDLCLHEFDHLILKKKMDVDKDADVLGALNPCTRKETAAVGDWNMRKLARGEIIQLERKGYFRCDVPFTPTNSLVVLFAIPDGRQPTSMKGE